MTDVKDPQSRVESGRRATLDLAIPSTRANSFITDICLWFVHGRGDWLPVASWVSLLGALNVSGPNARTSLHRMSKAGFLERRAEHGRRGYGMTTAWIDYIGPTRDGMLETEASDKWALLTFSIPEARRADRHVIRTILGRRGFAPLGNAVWIASAARLPEARFAIEASGLAEYVDMFLVDYNGFSKPSELVRRCWDIDTIAASYTQFIRVVRGRLPHPPLAQARAFADVIFTSNDWRRIDFTDPSLPLSALPESWPRKEAESLRDELFARFLDPARDYVDQLQRI